MRKGFVTLLIVFVLHASVHAADKIRIGFPDFSSPFLSLPLGQKPGFFQQEGIQAEFIRIRSIVALTALVSGELDYHTVLGPAIAAAVRGVSVKIVACYTPTVATVLIARPEFKSVEELKGKTIGLNSYGGGLEGQARLMFKKLGLDPDKDLKFLATGGVESRLTALKQGLTAATVGSPPIDCLGKKLGFIVLARANELFSYPTSGVVATVKKIKERPDEIKRVIKAGIKANRYIRENREATIQLMIEWIKTDKEMATAAYESVIKLFNDDGSVPEKGLLLVIDELKKLSKVEREISLSEVADLSILRGAQKELGIKGK